MRFADTEVVDTFAEAFPMWGARIVTTAESRAWAQEAARSMTGFATSVTVPVTGWITFSTVPPRRSSSDRSRS